MTSALLAETEPMTKRTKVESQKVRKEKNLREKMNAMAKKKKKKRKKKKTKKKKRKKRKRKKKKKKTMMMKIPS